MVSHCSYLISYHFIQYYDAMHIYDSSRECQVANWKGGDGKVGHKHSCAGNIVDFHIIYVSISLSCAHNLNTTFLLSYI